MKLADYLFRENISRAEFARRIGMSEGTVSLLCSNMTWLSRRTAQRIADETRGAVTPNDFIDVRPEAAQ